MSYARQLLDSYPRALNRDAGVLAATIDALNDCFQACTADADADLGEHHLPELVKCTRLCLDGADVCTATISVTSRQTEYDPNVTKPLPSVSTFGEADRETKLASRRAEERKLRDGDDKIGSRRACCAGERVSRTRGPRASDTACVFAAVQAEDSRRIRTPRP